MPDKSEDEICIVLHDHNFDAEAAISALLDNDSSDVKVWLPSVLCVKPITGHVYRMNGPPKRVKIKRKLLSRLLVKHRLLIQ